MNRRKLLVASAAAVAGAATPGAFAAAFGTVPAQAVCALVPVDVAAAKRAGIDELRLLRHFPGEVAGAVSGLDLDVSLLDERGGLHTIYAWQLRRYLSSPVVQAGFRLRFEAAQLRLQVRVRGADKVPRYWNGQMPAGGDCLLLSARASTGAPPGLAELRMDAGRERLWLADGSRRDFEALLLRAA